MDVISKNNLMNLYDSLLVATLGCNKKIEEILQKFHQEHKFGRSYFFAEYISSQPFPDYIDYSKYLENRKINRDNVFMLAPFAPRLAKDSISIPKPVEELSKDLSDNFNEGEQSKIKNIRHQYTILNTEDQISKLKVFLPLDESIIFETILKHAWPHLKVEAKEWDSNIKPNLIEQLNEGLNIIGIEVSDEINFPYPESTTDKYNDKVPLIVLENFGTASIKLYRKKAMGYFLDRGVNASYFTANKLTHMELLASRWGQSKSKCISIVIPIMTPITIFGYIWIWLPCLSKDLLEKDDTVMKLYKDLVNYICGPYAQALIIAYERFAELLFKDTYENSKADADTIDLEFSAPNKKIVGAPANVKWSNPFDRDHNYDDELVGSSRSIDIHLQRLWAHRKSLAKLQDDAIKESWFFDKYQVASDEMIKLLQNIICSARFLRKQQTSLPAVLVVGGAGSGKDKIPKLLKLFSYDYNNGQIYPINVSAIKPNFMIGPLITGVEIELISGNGNNKIETHVHGILVKIRNQTIESILKNTLGGNYKFDEAENKLKEISKSKDNPPAEMKGYFPVIVLDELNGLDVDSQGVLLRYLENSEIIPTGGIVDDYIVAGDKKIILPAECTKYFTNALIVGLMNEDPDEITREKAIDFIKKQQYLGGFIGDLLYEHIMRMRRLRADLKYRMIRNGKYIIPPLSERRADIPILFYVFVTQELEELAKGIDNKGNAVQFWITFDAFDELISPGYSWPGNVRELQALAKRATYLSYKDYLVKKDTSDQTMIICKNNIRKAMEEMEEMSWKKTTKELL